MEHLNWTKEELLAYGNLLEKKEIPTDLNKYKIYVHDFQVINNLLKKFGKNKKFGLSYKNPFKPFYIKLSGKELKSFISNNLFIERVPYTFLNPKTNEEQMQKLFIKFLKGFDIELYYTYISLISKKQISINNINDNNGNVQHLITFNKFFVTIKNNNFKYFSLIHEMGHIKQFELCDKNFDYLENLYKSLFVEVYSKYLELKWSEFLKEEDYIEISLKWREDFFTALSIYSERMLSFYSSKTPLITNKSHFIINFIGYLLAIGFKDKSNTELQKINKIICLNDNTSVISKINKIISKEEINNNLNDFFIQYKQDFYKQKQLKKYL